MGQKNFHVKSIDFSRGRVIFLFDHAKTADSNGLTPKSPILPLHMLIWYHETLYGDKKEKMSTHEHTWASMSKNAKSTDSSRFDIEIPF